MNLSIPVYMDISLKSKYISWRKYLQGLSHSITYGLKCYFKKDVTLILTVSTNFRICDISFNWIKILASAHMRKNKKTKYGGYAEFHRLQAFAHKKI